MKVWSLSLFLFLLSGQLFAQEQLALRLNEQGIMKIMQLALQYNSGVKGSRTVLIPQNIYKFTLPKEKLLSNPIVPIVNEISDLNLNHDLDFFLNISDVKVTGDVDAKSLKTTIFNSNDKGFDLKLSIDLPQVVIKGTKVSLCEDKDPDSKNCGNGLMATLSDLQVSTFKRPIILTIVMQLKTDGQVARVSIRSVQSTLEGEGAPEIDINFASIEVPQISIIVNNKVTYLDTSGLKTELLKYRSFLSKKLLAFAADFIANDVAEMINLYLINKEVATSFQLYRKEQNVKFNEFLNNRDQYPLRGNEIDNSKVAGAKNSPLSAMMLQISEIVRSAQLAIALQKISTPGNKDVELAGLVNFILNDKQINVKNTFGNSSRALPKVDLALHRNNDVSLAISEPLINGILDVANSTNLFQEIFKKSSPIQGVRIKDVKMHFSGSGYLVAVVNTELDLKQLKSDGARQWVKNNLASWLERHNNNSVIYFPIEVKVTPNFKVLPSGSVGIDLYVHSPFGNYNLPNSFGYPSNIQYMTNTVRNSVMNELKASLEPHTNKVMTLDLTKYLNASGVVFHPKSISIHQGAYLLLNLDIKDIKFNSKKPNSI